MRHANRKDVDTEVVWWRTAGPKLRKWYGEGERRPRDGQDPDPEDEEEPQGPADAILVTDGDSPTGELVILQLILARCFAFFPRLDMARDLLALPGD